MLQYITIWILENWSEFATLTIACFALFYAVRANNISKSAADAARASELIDLTIRAEDCLTEARRSFQALQRSCNQTRAVWSRHTRKHLPTLSSSVFKTPEHLSRISKVERDGAVLLQNAKQHLVGIEKFNSAQLARGFVEIKAAAIQIEGLAAQLEDPPTYFN